MNPRLHIDFATPGTKAAWTRLAVPMLAAAACAAAFLDYRAAAAELAGLASQVEDARRLADGAPSGTQVHDASGIDPKTVTAINRAITWLNVPWQDLFGIFERRRLPAVALLALEPDSQKQLVRVTAEAQGPEDMAAFLELLMREPGFAAVTLTRHEINQQDPSRPIRFVLEARWRMER